MQGTQAFKFTGSFFIAWTAPEDCVLVGISSVGVVGVVSYDPKVTVSDFIAPASSKVEGDCLGVVGSAATAQETKFIPIQKVPIPQGRRIFVASAGAGTILLHFDNTT